MNKKIAKLWVEELRSGHWEQGKLFLEHTNTYCVMGILANIAATYGICSHSGNGIARFDGKSFIVPKSVIEWAEMKTELGQIPGLKYSLAEMNDNGKSFKYLADIIERHWNEI